ncbi:uncharacterized protein RJT21DRAFT_133448 [Scheffersomyces amazonensis]|uniref:uncharacterized protein n=1 Tax=Scheffersomyces amazonensis TaxID=1078765 RepID=UPI00315C4EFE
MNFILLYLFSISQWITLKAISRCLLFGETIADVFNSSLNIITASGTYKVPTIIIEVFEIIIKLLNLGITFIEYNRKFYKKHQFQLIEEESIPQAGIADIITDTESSTEESTINAKDFKDMKKQIQHIITQQGNQINRLDERLSDLCRQSNPS